MKPKVMNIDDIPVREWSQGETFEARISWAGTTMASAKLGFNVAVVPAGKKPFPFHAHRANDELFFVLEGTGSVRIGPETHPIRAGDLISLPAGPDSAHQIINDSDADLRYLAVSTMESPEIVEYPDSKKIGLMAGSPPGGEPREDTLRHFTRVADGVGYWDGEE